MNEFERAWMEGIRACEEGKALQDCPHPLGSALAGEWNSGWELAALALPRKQVTHADG